MSGTNTVNSPLNDQAQKQVEDFADRVRKHLRKNRETYVHLGTFAAFFMIGRWSKKTPKVDELAIVQTWIDELQKQGLSPYALNPQQVDFWNSAYDYAEAYAKNYGLPLAKAISELTREFQEDAKYLGRYVASIPSRR